MGNFLRLANLEETRRYYYENTEEFIELKADLSKRQASALLKVAPRKEDDLDGGLRFIARAFEDLVVSWSLTDDNGNPIPPSVEVYEQLDAAAAAWIDRTVGDHLRARLGGDAEAAEEKPENSPAMLPKASGE